MNKTLLITTTLILLSTLLPAQKNTLWYDKPAKYFEESLVLGNGKTGAAIFGGIKNEKIYLNDITLWSGEPVDPYMNPEAYKYVEKVRKALKDKNYKEADSLNRFIQGSFSQSYAPMGTLLLNFPGHNEISAYRRELDLNNATATVSYKNNDVTFKREHFISYPAKVMMIRLTADKEKSITGNIAFESLLKYSSNKTESGWEINGYAPYHAEPSYRGDMENAVMFDENRGTRFTIAIYIENIDGEVTIQDNSIDIQECSEAIIYISAETSFNGFDKNPASEGIDNKKIAEQQLKNALKTGYKTIIEQHIEDYQFLFNRVNLTLTDKPVPNLPTDERLKRYTKGDEDKHLEALYFHYGRYLLISSSRTDGIPANLQGIWNHMMRPPWSSNYTMNINTEENYWLAESGNLSELHSPLLTFIGNLAKTGAITAKTFYNCKGWCACHNSDIWAMSNPVGDFGKGHPVWANWNMSGVWLSTHLWEHYQYTSDTSFLRERAWPLMKGAAEFCLDWMIKDENGYLITSPSTSPENLYKTPDGYIGATLSGATCDIAMIKELFLNISQAKNILNIENDFTKEISYALSNIKPYSIGNDGSLQEWYHDWEDQDPKHRHQTHLFGLHPGLQITPYETPKLAEACKKALEIKGDETTGWSKGWRINLWARLLDGQRAYKMYRELLSYVPADGSTTSNSHGGGTYPNLLDAHPPFQIDGNFGGAAAVIEMLMQSTIDEIHLLPAIPEYWNSGEVSGLKARGGFEVDMTWEDGKVTHLEIFSEIGGETTVYFNDKNKNIRLDAGEIQKVVL